MFASIAAKLANPLLKWGIVGGVAVIGLASLWFHGYTKGKKVERTHYEALMMQQSQEHAKRMLAAAQMTSTITKDDLSAKRETKERIKYVTKEVIRYVEKRPAQPLDPEFIRLYDSFRGVLNNTASSLLPTAPHAGTTEVPRGGLGTSPSGIVQSTEDGTTVELTTDELTQAVIDMSEKYALMKQSYKGATDWNEGRERIELERLNQ